jgi:carbon-monoxide dehydrogenase medium subunit
VQSFHYIRAGTVEEAVAQLAAEGEQARALSGGTDLIVQLREGRRTLERVVDIKHLPELVQLSYDPAVGLTIGAAVACHQIYGDATIAAAYPGLIDAATLIGGIQIQGRASLGGNLCNASPAADSIPALIAHGAICEIAGPNGRRFVPVEAICTGPGRTILEPGELLVAIRIAAPVAHSGAAYLRFTPRNEMDIAVVGAGVHVTLDAAGEHFTAARVALGAVAATPLLVEEAGAALVGQPVAPDTIAEAARLAREAARPIDDIRGTVAQRRHLAGVLVRRALEQAVARAKG